MWAMSGTQIEIPNCTVSAANDQTICTDMYVCVNDGCPDAGATTMACKVGYAPHSPLRAVCDKGYFQKLRACSKCGGDSRLSPAAIAMFVGTLIVAMYFVCFLYRHRRFLASTDSFAHVKILVAFATVVITVDSQVSSLQAHELSSDLYKY
jgi:hypothetical protein